MARKAEPKRSLSAYRDEWRSENRTAVRIMFSDEDFRHLVEMLTEAHPEDHLTLRLRARLAKGQQH